MHIEHKDCYQDSKFVSKILYQFDSLGFVRVPGFLSGPQVEHLNAVIDKSLAEFIEAEGYAPTKFPFFELDPFFFDILTHELVLEMCAMVTGEWFRLDHAIGLEQPGKMRLDNGDLVSQDETTGNLHGAPYASQYSCFYANVYQQPLAGQFVVGIALEDQKPSDGGFCYIPGSHKHGDHRLGKHVLKDVLGDDFDSDMVTVPQLNAGDLVFFTESTIHGMAPWKAQSRRRRNIYYKISPGFLAWRSYEGIKKYLPLARTDIQRKLLRPPFVAEFKEDQVIGENKFREATYIPKTKRLAAEFTGGGREALGILTGVIRKKISNRIGKESGKG